ncbi:lantibiotic dehydratase [Streptosporangium fragile]|uniref:Lantibiotic dehydratase n=1 Tax=Streptosporangium fragile TaxID=46186 RepID=A0ABN3W9F2_9ACTN
MELVPSFLLRTSGMPVRLLDGLAAPELYDLSGPVLAAGRRVHAERLRFEELWPTLREAARRTEPRRRSLRLAVRCLEAVQVGEPLEEPEAGLLAALGAGDWAGRWDEAVTACRSVQADVARAHEAALAAARRRVAEAFGLDRVRHATFVSNPGFLRNALARPLAAHGPWTSGARRTAATAHRYLRRFATRCETVSFFGPVLHARFDPGRAEALTVGEPGQERVLVEASTWLAELLQEETGRRVPPPDRRVWRSPVFRELPSGAGLERVLDGRRFKVPEPALRLWRAADGRRTLGELAALLGTDPGAAERLARGLGQAVIVSGCRLPATELHALSELAGRAGAASPPAEGAASPPAGQGDGAADGGPGGEPGLAVALAAARARYAAEPWPGRAAHLEEAERLAATLGEGTRQGAGRHYADREVFREDRSSPYSERVVLGGPALERIRAALAGMLPLCYLGALLSREDARDAVRAALGGRPAPLARLAVAELRDDRVRTGRLQAALRDLVAARAAGAPGERPAPPDLRTGAGIVRLTSAEVAGAVAGLWSLVPPGDAGDPCLPSPDLMAAGRDLATATWVLSEMHDDCSSGYGGLENPLHSTPDLLWRDFTERVVRLVPPDRAATIVSRRRSAHVTPELPGVSIELSGLSRKPREQTAPIADVTVPATGDAVEVAGVRRLLYPGDLSSPLHRAVSLPAVVPVPVDLGEHTPRIMIDDLVYQRARWRIRLPEERAGDAMGRWLAMQRLREDNRLPRRVFVRHPAEPKPLHVDFADPLAVEDLARSAPAEILVSEMLPTPDQLWWHVDGDFQCAELRLGCLVHRRPRESK